LHQAALGGKNRNETAIGTGESAVGKRSLWRRTFKVMTKYQRAACQSQLGARRLIHPAGASPLERLAKYTCSRPPAAASDADRALLRNHHSRDALSQNHTGGIPAGHSVGCGHHQSPICSNLSHAPQPSTLQTTDYSHENGTLTVAGTTTSAATNVTVNTSNAIRYADYTFASTNQTLAEGANTFTAIAKDTYGRLDTNTINTYLPSTSTFTYDQNGNLTGDGNRSFAYDYENQLISVWVTNVWRSDFVYDGKMRRRIRREYLWQSSAWSLKSETRYVYDGNLVIQERDANNLPLVTYTRGNDLSGSMQGAGGIGGLLARTDNRLFAIGDPTAHAYYHADGNGNVTCLSSTNQIVVALYLYDPYGNILSLSGPLADANLYRFSSKEFHVASGLVYYLYRFYDSNLQRWQNRDPLGDAFGVLDALEGLRTPRIMAGEESEGPNLFQFVRNDPVVSFDTDGRGAAAFLLPGICVGFACYEYYEFWKTMCHALYVTDRAADKEYQRCSRLGEHPDQPKGNPALKKTCVRYGLYK
jgi:RHS repeat-associated protein